MFDFLSSIKIIFITQQMSFLVLYTKEVQIKLGRGTKNWKIQSKSNTRSKEHQGGWFTQAQSIGALIQFIGGPSHALFQIHLIESSPTSQSDVHINQTDQNIWMFNHPIDWSHKQIDWESTFGKILPWFWLCTIYIDYLQHLHTPIHHKPHYE